MKKKYAFFLLVLIGLMNVTHAQTVFTTYENDPLGLKETTLENGMRVLLIEKHDKSEITGSFVVHVGSKNDPPDNTGMAHYLEHMLFKGTKELGTSDYESEKKHLERINELYDQLAVEKNKKKRALINQEINEASRKAAQFAIPNEFQRTVEEMGGTRLNAFTSHDMTIYLNTFPPNQLEKWLDLYVHRFIDPVFRSFQTELETVYEEKNRKNNDAMNNLLETFLQTCFEGHPYGDQTTLGHTEHLKNPSLSVMYEYFKTYYVPGNMALVLVGDFDAQEIFPVVEEKLSMLPDRKLVKKEKFKMDPLVGRIERKTKSSPVKMAIYGFRTPGLGDLNKAKMDLLIALLNNDSETGLLDELSVSGKMLAVLAFNYSFNDQGIVSIMSVPKLIGQSFDEAENLIFHQLELLKNGEFDEERLIALKNELIKQRKRHLESNQNISFSCYNYFLSGAEWTEMTKYVEVLESLTKSDIVDYANEIFGENLVVLYSKRGAQKHAQLSQPGYEPLPNGNKLSSTYAESIRNRSVPALIPEFVDFDKDVNRTVLKNGTLLSCVENPLNSVFTLTFRWETGAYENPHLLNLQYYLSSVGTAVDSFSVFKWKMQQIRASYSFAADERYFYLNIDGEDELLRETLLLVEQLLANPAKDEHKTSEVVEELKSNSKFDRSSSEELSKALTEYAMYGRQSKYLHVFPLDSAKRTDASEYLEIFKTVQTYPLSIDYVGNNVEISDYLEQMITVKPIHKRKESAFLDRKEANAEANTIYFVHNKKATQALVNFNFYLGKVPQEDQYKMQAFNAYFGRGMTSLIFQEIREFRALAYSAYGVCLPALTTKDKAIFKGFVGCQSDKIAQVINIMQSLLSDFPEKPERIGYIRQSLILKCITSKPDFRHLNKQIETWEAMGYDNDPSEYAFEAYQNISFDDIRSFYNDYIAGKPLTISIVGDKKKIDFKSLAQFGTLIELDKEDIIVN